MKSLTLFISGLALALPGVVWLFWLIALVPTDRTIPQEYPWQFMGIVVLEFTGHFLLWWANREVWTKGR